MLRQIISVLFIFSVSINWAQKTSQDYEQELKAQSNSIQSLRDEIEATKKRIQSENRKEKSSARRVNNLSEEISLLQRLLKEIDKEEKLIRSRTKMEESCRNYRIGPGCFLPDPQSPDRFALLV